MGLFGSNKDEEPPPLTDQEKTDLTMDDHMRRNRPPASKTEQVLHKLEEGTEWSAEGR